MFRIKIVVEFIFQSGHVYNVYIRFVVDRIKTGRIRFKTRRGRQLINENTVDA